MIDRKVPIFPLAEVKTCIAHQLARLALPHAARSEQVQVRFDADFHIDEHILRATLCSWRPFQAVRALQLQSKAIDPFLLERGQQNAAQFSIRNWPLKALPPTRILAVVAVRED